MAARHRPDLALQLTWFEGAGHLWAIDAHDATLGRFADVTRLVDRDLGRQFSVSTIPARISIRLPDPLGEAAVPALRISDAALAEIAPLRQSSTLRWFADVVRLAIATVRAGRLRPALAAEGAVRRARWVPVGQDEIANALGALAEVMPPACAVTDIAALFDLAVDSVARQALSGQGWRPPRASGGRGSDYRAAQAVFRALASASGSVLYRGDDVPALAALCDAFAGENDRAAGMAVIGARLRLHLPDSLDGPWRVTLELVDLDRPERWCSADDVVAGHALALDLARRQDRLPRLHDRIVDCGRALADRLGPLLAVFKGLAEDPSAETYLELGQVEAFLAAAPTCLDQLGIGLLGPEQLIRARIGLRGTAVARPERAADGRLSAGALVRWNATVDESPIDDAQFERAAASGASLIHVNGRWVRLGASELRSTLERLHRHRQRDADVDVAGLLKLVAAADGQPSGPRVTADDDGGWIAELLAGLPDERLTETREPADFVGELRHYQRRGLSWMGFLGRLGLGGCLADDMGLGKTATTLAHLSTRGGPHLVVCPLSVVNNWASEAARFTPRLQVSIHHGNERGRGDAASGQLIPADILVTTYGLVSRDIAVLSSQRWSTLVLDEAQFVKNHLTRAARAVRQIDADQKLALTGTPVENHLGELWSILDAVNPGLYGSASQFNERYARPIQRSADPAATQALRSLTQPFILRRTKADKTLLPELPEKIEQIAWATLTREQAVMYQAVVDRLLANAQAETGIKRRGMVLAALTRLKQICNHPAHAVADGSRLAGRSGKLNRFDELVDDLLGAGERALVFTQFREMGLLLQRHLRSRLQVEAAFLHGGVSRSGRESMVEQFQAGRGAPLLLVSLKAGGTGLNLTSASQVIHYDRWWNPAVEDQATDRAWRLGQSHVVLVHKLVCEGTLEERIGQLIDDKRELANSVLGSGERWLTELSTEDLRSLVMLSPDTAGPR